jgi:hypothetical protein
LTIVVRARSPYSIDLLRAALAADETSLAASAVRLTSELAGDVAALLADTNWWVRASAKESLLALGADGFRAALVALEHPDRFARDGALEIVVAPEHLHDLLVAAEEGDAAARALATTIEERRPGTIDRLDRLAA